MSNLVTITAKFYDKSGSRIINLNVQSRYAGSSKANIQKTDSRGLFVFQASPNRTVEILAKPPNQKEYSVFKTINSSASSSEENPIKVQLPKTIDEYQQIKQPTSTKGIVSTFFKVVDSNGKVMKNFPVQSRPKGKGNSPDKFTDDQGIVEVKSSPNRDIEVLVLTSNDQFVLKSSINSGSGSSQPIPIKLDEPYAKFLSRSMIKILDRDGSDYIVEKTNVEMLIVESGKKLLYSISNGKLPLQSMVGQKLEFTVYKPDGKPLKPQSYMATRIKNKPAELHLDVDVTKGTTAPNDPEINKQVKFDILITMEQMQKMWPAVKNVERIKIILDELNNGIIDYKLDTRLRQAHFMAQVFAESGYLFSLRENIAAYTEKNLLDNMGYYQRNRAEAKIDAAIKDKVLKEKTICNKAYMDVNRPKNRALGNIKEDDGYKFIGRGLKMTTGRYNYTQFDKFYPKAWPDEKLDFVENPELIEQPKYAARTALVYWLANKLYDKADLGATHTVVDGITRGINAGATSTMLIERRSYFDKAKTIFK